ncbi:MAG: response regulator [Hydrogenophaga sp.]|nr:response regulator [Hydrogenophaga sp.]
MSDIPQRLALDLQRALQDLQRERERTQQLLTELDRQNGELDRLRGSVHRESNSRLLAEEALDETRDRLELAVEAAGLALWDWQLATKQVFLTARWGDMLGDIAMDGHWSAADLHARIHPEDQARVAAFNRDLLSGRRVHAVTQYRVRTVSHDWIWVESHGMVAEHAADGRPLRLMGTLADIGERKQAEEEIHQARELAEQASLAKSEFLANISHEVRTPLNALMGLTRLLMDSPLTAEQKTWLELMDSSAHALLELLNDVLDLSRIEAGKLTVEQVRFDLHELLHELGALYAEQARTKPQAFALDIDSGLPRHMEGDPGRLRQVLNNLLSNALKFTPRGGRIHVRADAVDSDTAAARQTLRLQVQDTGVGISSRQQATIFDAFTQADASTARRYGGSGLGLAICSRLVRLMGGTIELRSALGEGSTFTVTIPLGELPATDTVPMTAPMELDEVARAGDRFAGLTTLVAEDHPVNELLMSQLLKRLGCHVLTARDGQQAFQRWSEGGVDLVLMDVQMPGTNGLEATRLIRDQEIRQGRPHTPIVAVTANAMNGDREACLAAGMDGYTPKPVSPMALMRAMDDALLRARGLPSRLLETHEPAPAPSPHTPAIADALDVEKLRRRLDGDEETLRQLAQAMRTDLSERMMLLSVALKRRDADHAVAHAHGLKGSLGSMTAERAARLAKGLELAARSKDWQLFERALPLMQDEARTLDTALAALLKPRSSVA